MAREIIVLDIQKTSGGGDFTVTAAFWLTAPANRLVPKPNFVSAVPLAAAASWGATAQEVAALQAGTVVEQVVITGQFPSVTGAAAVKTELQNEYATAQAAVNAAGASSKWIGASWDGATWTPAP